MDGLHNFAVSPFERFIKIKLHGLLCCGNVLDKMRLSYLSRITSRILTSRRCRNHNTFRNNVSGVNDPIFIRARPTKPLQRIHDDELRFIATMFTKQRCIAHFFE